MHPGNFRLCVSLFAILAGGCASTSGPDFQQAVSSETRPWTHESFDVDDDRFMFAIFSDLYGGEREGVFAVAMEQLQMLRPELILNVGDLIDGGTEDRDRLTREWNAFDAKVTGMKAPVFYIGGNHDLTNLAMRTFWEERYGARRMDGNGVFQNAGETDRLNPHSYSLTQRNGRDYIHLGTTSGGQNPSDEMAFDHVTLVTVTGEGPSIVNLRLDGILDKSGHIPLDGDDLCYQASACAGTSQE